MLEYEKNHERANVITHLLGFVYGLIALPILVWAVSKAPETGWFDVFGSIVYSIGFLMVFGFSTLYHAKKNPRTKFLMKIWDHISIYYLIAGTYTPFLISYASPEDARTLLYILWGLALFGTIFKIFFTGKYRIISTAVYLAMGWLIFAAPDSFMDALPSYQFSWIAIGGASYTIGVIFYLVKSIPYHHAIWHVFVLGGAIAHYIGIYTIFL
jgi:hemolysin III